MSFSFDTKGTDSHLEGYTRVLSQDNEVLHYEKDGKKFRRFGNKLVEM